MKKKQKREEEFREEVICNWGSMAYCYIYWTRGGVNKGGIAGDQHALMGQKKVIDMGEKLENAISYDCP